MKNEHIQIVIIHDDLKENHPAIVYLRGNFPHIEWFKSTEKGVEYIQQNLHKHIIVLLDYDFRHGKNGDWALKAIRSVSKLIPVILFTDDYPTTEFKKFINLNTLAFIRKSDFEGSVLQIEAAKQKVHSFIEAAKNQWNGSIVGILESWISIRQKDRRNKDYTILIKGTPYSLEELIKEVQEDSDLGKFFSEKVNELTIQKLIQKDIDFYKIVIIDDQLVDEDPLIIELETEFNTTVKLLNTPKEGIEYVENHIDEIMVILLDYRFSTGEPNGSWVIQKIREKSKIIPIILMTVQGDKIKDYDVFINNHIFAFTKGGTEGTIEKVHLAKEYWEQTIAGAFEEWVNSKEKSKRDVPYLLTLDNKSFSLNDLLKEVMLQTDLGQETLKDLKMAVIDLLIRKKMSIND